MLFYGSMLGIETAHVAVFAGSPQFETAYDNPNNLREGFMTACFPIFASGSCQMLLHYLKHTLTSVGSALAVFLSSYARRKPMIVISTMIWAIGCM
jgi:hypothetical protein